MTSTTTTTLAGTPIPASHLSTAIPGNRGTLWVYGFRGHDGTARYSVVSEGALPGDSADALLDGGDWAAAWRLLAGTHYKANRLADLLRSVLPTMADWYAEATA